MSPMNGFMGVGCVHRQLQPSCFNNSTRVRMVRSEISKKLSLRFANARRGQSIEWGRKWWGSPDQRSSQPYNEYKRYFGDEQESFDHENWMQQGNA